MALGRFILASSLAVNLLAESAVCPEQYAAYSSVITVSHCTTPNSTICIVDGHCNEIPSKDGDTFSFDGSNLRVGQPFDGLVAELPSSTVSGDFTYAAVDVGDLSKNTKLTSLSFYRTNRANLANAKLPSSLRSLVLTSSVGLKKLPPLDYSSLTLLAAGNELTEVNDLNVPKVQDLSFNANAGLVAIRNLKVTSNLLSFHCNICPLTTFTVDDIGYHALASLVPSNFSVKSLDVTSTCVSPGVIKELHSTYSICVVSANSTSPSTTKASSETSTPTSSIAPRGNSTTTLAPTGNTTNSTTVIVIDNSTETDAPPATTTKKPESTVKSPTPASSTEFIKASIGALLLAMIFV